MGKDDFSKIERKWRKQPLFRKQRRSAGILVRSFLLLVFTILIAFSVVAGLPL